jgi:GDP-L-fucose synthase
MNKDSSIFIAGHRGLVGSAVVRAFRSQEYNNLVLKTHAELDLLNQSAVQKFFSETKIDHVLICAARVGGIHANNSYQADFLYENLMIACNVIKSAAESNVSKLLFLGSTCIYPKHAPQPMKESSLLTGPLESTNEAYAIAKIAGLKLCEKYQSQYGKNFISAMPTNLYGPNDNFHPENSHVVPGMLLKFHKAKLKGDPSVTVWGSGKPQRELLYVDDLADALVYLMNNYNDRETINVGSGFEVTIAELAQLIKETVGYTGQIVFDSSKPDGTPRKIADTSRINSMGWKAKTSLKEGLKKAYLWALENKALEKYL